MMKRLGLMRVILISAISVITTSAYGYNCQQCYRMESIINWVWCDDARQDILPGYVVPSYGPRGCEAHNAQIGPSRCLVYDYGFCWDELSKPVDTEAVNDRLDVESAALLLFLRESPELISAVDVDALAVRVENDVVGRDDQAAVRWGEIASTVSALTGERLRPGLLLSRGIIVRDTVKTQHN